MIEEKNIIPISKPTVPDLNCILKEYQEVFESGMFTNHKYVDMFEKKVKQYIGVRNVVCVSSCTLGLILLEKCLRLKGEVIVPSFTFPATVHSLMWNNLTPVFVDCDPDTFNIDVQKAKKKINKKTSAILGVYIFGNPPDMDRLEYLSKKYNIKLIFDSAHGLGASFHGKCAGNFGDAEVFSLAPTKLITTGEGGLITTDNDDLADKLKLARNYGNPGDYNCYFIGLNARMNELSAILGLKSMDLLESNLSKRQGLVDLYKQELNEIKGISFQKIRDKNQSSFNYFSIIIDKEKCSMTNKDIYEALKKKGIMSRIYFSPPVHKQKAYKRYYNLYKDSLPYTDKISGSILCLPLYADMNKEVVLKVCEIIKEIQKQ